MGKPELRLSPADKELLRLLGELIAGQSKAPSGNRPANAAVLSDFDAATLLELIQAFVASPQFFKGSHFIEALTAHGGPSREAREIYLSLRKERGRSRVMSSYHWSEYQVRLGTTFNRYPYSGTVPMPDATFVKQERALLLAAGVSSEVADLAVTLLYSHMPKLEKNGRSLPTLQAADIRRSLTVPFSRARLASGEIPTTKLIAAMSLVADIGVMFSTRDWDVVGTLSSAAGCAVALMTD